MSIITFTVTGTVAPNVTLFGTSYGIDRGGYFGSAGASLAGDPFTVTWTGIDCNCAGTASFNPVIDAVLTINGHDYDFGAGLSAYNDFYDNLHQVEVAPGNISLTTEYGGFGAQQGSIFSGHDGVFYIQPCCNADVWTQAFLTISVPAPVMGAELPGLLAALIIFGGFYWKRHQLRSTPSM